MKKSEVHFESRKEAPKHANKNQDFFEFCAFLRLKYPQSGGVGGGLRRPFCRISGEDE
jgi:hypothetical protein